MALKETVESYIDLLVLQYRDKPKARKNIGIYVKQALGDMLATELNNAFDVDTAVGVQLDVIGKYVGVPRNIGIAPDLPPFFGFYDIGAATQNPNGFQDSTDASVNAGGIFYQTNYVGTQNVDLSDSAYRLVIKLKIALNQNSSSLAEIQQYLFDNLPGVFSLVDNADMSLTYTLLSPPPLDPAVLTPYLPKPMGVSVDFVYPTAAATPGTLSESFATVITPVNYVATTVGQITAAPDPATSALYLWEKVSGDDIVIVSPYTANTSFRYTFNAWESRSAVFRCRVTTIPGALVSYTNNVVVTIAATP